MRKLIFSMPVTLDGYIEGPHHELDWVIPDEQLHDFYAELLNSADLILYGRVTYELMLGYWPKASADPMITAGELRFAEAINNIPKIVYSTTLQKVDWNTRLFKTFNPVEIQEMKSQVGKDLLLGGGVSLASQFFQHGLVDEYQLVYMPAVIGAGKALFTGIDTSIQMNYRWSRRFSSGAIVLCYQPDGKL
jgi:dihydrofolate reductase